MNVENTFKITIGNIYLFSVFLLKLSPTTGLESLNLLTGPEQQIVRQVNYKSFISNNFEIFNYWNNFERIKGRVVYV